MHADGVVTHDGLDHGGRSIDTPSASAHAARSGLGTLRRQSRAAQTPVPVVEPTTGRPWRTAPAACPFFVVDNRYAISGAQPVEVFEQAAARADADLVGRTP
jgi:hypothetical protein